MAWLHNGVALRLTDAERYSSFRGTSQTSEEGVVSVTPERFPDVFFFFYWRRYALRHFLTLTTRFVTFGIFMVAL